MNEPAQHKVRVFIFLQRGLNPAVWKKKNELGQVWDETPYGYGAAGPQFATTWASSGSELWLVGQVRRALNKVIGFDLVHAFRNRRSLLQSDVVWTHTEREHLAAAFIFRLYRASGPKLLAQTVWLWDEWSNLSKVKRSLFAWLLERADVEVVHSDLNLQISHAEVPGRTVARVPFGTAAPRVRRDPNLNASSIGRPVIISAGSDRDRDWALLAQVASELHEADFMVFSPSASARRIHWPSNVHLVTSGSLAELRAAYARAGVFALPLRQNTHASGATVAGESMSLGVPLVATRSGGIDAYVEGSGATLVDIGDHGEFARSLRDFIAVAVDPHAIKAKRDDRGLTQVDYVRRYEWITCWLMQGGDFPRVASDFTRVTAPPTSCLVIDD